MGSEQVWRSCPGPLCSLGVTIGSEQTCGATGVPLLTWRRGSHSPALALSSLQLRVHLGLRPPRVWVPPEQSGQRQGQMSPEAPPPRPSTRAVGGHTTPALGCMSLTQS